MKQTCCSPAPGLEITADHRSMIGKKLLMIGGKARFGSNLKKQGKA
jgi:hypothetical protein